MRWLTMGLLVVATACGSGDGDDASEADIGRKPPSGPAAEAEPQGPPPMSDEQLRERPWEVVSSKGETYLANVFYADPIENEQVMPWMIDGRAVIDRLVYPTLGNPNLYVKDDASDELTMVLRMEPNAIEHLNPKIAAGDGRSPAALTLDQSDESGIAFFLVARSARARGESGAAMTTGAGVHRIVPKAMLVNAEPDDMPASLKARKTIRFVFDRAAMAHVPAGLYDARFEVRKEGLVFANVFEWQYNAVRVFDRALEEYTALNVTDTQVSVGDIYKNLTADKLDDFVDGVNANVDPAVKSAAFITFNGDLHNGGSPGTIRQAAVANTYNAEAKRILGALKRLNLPIFLTAGNHDGYVALGHVPSAVARADAAVGTTLKKVVEQQNNLAWPDFSWDTYQAFLTKTDAQRDGLRRDVVTGAFERRSGDAYGASFSEVPRADRNMVLYDGLYQWQKTYGPLYTSWTFGKNRYLSMNSYELRQHRRTGWGMYTVNYGGAIGQTQMAWLDRELGRSQRAGEDVTLLLHHDPRGGHKGADLGYYFPLIRYQSVQQSTINYLFDEIFTPAVCKQDWVTLSVNQRDSCLHDGLQEWMAPDEDFDRQGAGFYMSGIELLTRVAKYPQVRTLLLGHAHFNSLEVMQQGDTLVPNRVQLDANGASARSDRIEALETANPVRRFAWQSALAPAPRVPGVPMDAAGDVPLDRRSFDDNIAKLDAMLMNATAGKMRTLDAPAGKSRELAIIRLTSAADLTSQKYGSDKMFGWSVLHVTRQAAGVPRINRLTYMIHRGTDAFEKITTVDVDRTKRLDVRGPENPVDALFDW
ncbi:MAG: metallophosphoesterase [Labilithrix sp.]|nr:metallophosphoesterase [Labilithrix sp.]